MIGAAEILAVTVLVSAQSPDCVSGQLELYPAFGAARSEALRWSEFLATLDTAAPIGPQMEPYRTNRGVPVNFDALPAGRESYLEFPGPCGGSYGLFVGSFAGLVDDPSTIADPVVQLGPDGSHLRRWVKPYDSMVVALRGDTLFVDYDYLFRTCYPSYPEGLKVWMAIRPDGSFTLVDPFVEVSYPETCGGPAAAPDATPCWRFEDLESGESVRLSFWGPCC